MTTTERPTRQGTPRPTPVQRVLGKRSTIAGVKCSQWGPAMVGVLRRVDAVPLALALHEGAHAVAHVALGLGFEYVSVVPSDEDRGYVESHADYSPDAHLFVIAAGPAASAVDLWRSTDYDLDPAVVGALVASGGGEWDGDLAVIHDDAHLLGMLHPATQSSAARLTTMVRAIGPALSFVINSWSAVTVVADALVERGTLDYDEVYSLVELSA